MNAFDYFFEKTAYLDKPFLVGKEEISFNQLYTSSLNLASWLEEEVGRNKHIILVSINDLFFITSYLAIIKSGNICIPLDPSIEKENFNYIKELTNPVLIFLTKENEKRLELQSTKCLLSDTVYDYKPKGKKQIDKIFDKEICAEIIFTSGSTGKPKGVMISHKNLISNSESIVEYLKLSQDERMLVVLPFYYCYGLSLLHTHLRVGGSIVLNNSFIFLGSIIKDLKEHKCTGFAGVPSHFQILLRKSDSFKKTVFPDLKYVTQAGGKLATIFIDEFRESFPAVKFFVMYGQTEATARLSYLPPELYEKKKGSMGKGIPGVELKVINEKGKGIKPGETGEVIARGENIMKGYFADEEGTRHALRNGWLFTGDLGTIDKDGYIYLTARKKEIIKVRGKRISPKEIEAVILEITEVIDCSVEGIDDEIEGEMLKATVVIRKDAKNRVTGESIMKHCSKHLALYKIPHVYELKEELTISATGKKIKK
ncbi:MAG: AMP-binding protein [Bacteroidales bacterium]|jgi:acyl-CoA synthetase (AMP-forming)/AMP-acid ligase II